MNKSQKNKRKKNKQEKQSKKKNKKKSEIIKHTHTLRLTLLSTAVFMVYDIF